MYVCIVFLWYDGNTSGGVISGHLVAIQQRRRVVCHHVYLHGLFEQEPLVAARAGELLLA